MSTKEILDEFYKIVDRAEIPNREISRLAGYDYGTMYTWRRDHRSPSLHALAHHLDVLGYELTIVPKENSDVIG